jgi:hypothetical protein
VERLGIDFDKTLAEGPPLRLRAGAADALRSFKEAGHHLTLHSARSTPDGAAPVLEDEAGRFWQYGEIPARTRFQWELFEEMREFLKSVGVWELFDDIWTSPGKPLVDHFIEDLSLLPDWVILKRQFGGANG